MAAPGSPRSLVPRLLLAALLSLAAVLFSSEPAEARRLAAASTVVELETAGFSTHMSRVMSFRCSGPQPRAVPSVDVVTESLAPEEHVMPPMTVLHRCDGGSGCCDQAAGLSCAPAAEGGEETVSLVFRIEAHFAKRTRFVWAQAVNHTACECRNLNAV